MRLVVATTSVMSSGDRRPVSSPRRYAFLLVPDFPLMSFSSVVAVLRTANWISGHTLYDWIVLTSDGGPVTAGTGLTLMADAAIDDVEPPALVMVGAGIGGWSYQDARTFSWLRDLGRRGAVIGAFETGSWLLARAGVLYGHRCTVHWEDIPSFRESFPDIEVTDSLYEIDGRRVTCSGGSAALDLVLHLVANDHGQDLAGSIADAFLHDQVRDGDRHQRIGLDKRMGVDDDRLLAAVLAMEQHIEDPLSLQQVSRVSRVPMRSLERLFKMHLGCAPSAYYRDLRLKTARRMLLHGSESILDVALATGFVSASHFARCYRSAYGRSPRDDRIRMGMRRPLLP